MSGLKLCRTKQGKRAYYIPSVKCNIYSLEELCYCIYNNIYSIDSSFICAELIEYIEEELMEKPLANTMKALLKDGAELKNYIILIMNYVDYYSKKELEEFFETMESVVKQPKHIRLKNMADNYLERKYYNSAIKGYHNLLNNVSGCENSFIGKVEHNMAVAYSRLFLYEQAAVLFKSAYEHGHNPESLKMYYIALKLSDGENEHLDSDECYTALRRLEAGLDEANATKQFAEINSIFELIENGNYNEYRHKIGDRLVEWIDEYKEITR